MIANVDRENLSSGKAPTPPPITNATYSTLHDLAGIPPALNQSAGSTVYNGGIEPVPVCEGDTVSEAAAAEDTTTTKADPTEEQLESEILELWHTFSKGKGTMLKVNGIVRQTREQLKENRNRLSARLYDLKKILSKPGRDGQWSSFLCTRNISKATADRLVKTHTKSLSEAHVAEGVNVLTEHSPVSAEVTVWNYLNGLWPKLSSVLTTREAAELFLAALTERVNKKFALEAAA